MQLYPTAKGANMNFTQEQLDTLQLPIRGKRIKLEVMDDNFQTLATIEGNAKGGSLQKDATNFVRRTGSINLCVPSVASANTFLDYVEGITINVNGKIWLDKNVKIWVGIDNYKQPYGDAPKTVWYNFGICLIDAPSRSFSADGYTMDFNVIDLVAKLNGDRAGQLTITETIYPRVQGYDNIGNPVYTKTEDAISNCISQLANIKKYTIYPIPQKWSVLPFDIKLQVGGTVYSALEQFLGILSGWQMYYDNEGVFVVEPIPSGENDIAYPLQSQMITSDVNSVDFNNVRNQVIVYGRSHNIDFYTENIDYDVVGNPIFIFDEAIDPYKFQVGSTIIGFHTSIGSDHGLQFGDIIEYITIVYGGENGTTLFSHQPVYWYEAEEIGISLYDGVYVLRIRDATVIPENGDTPQHIDFSQPIELECLGRQQCQACMVNGNIESPYYINKQYKARAYYAEVTDVSYVNGMGEVFTGIGVQITDAWNSPRNGDIMTLYIPIKINLYESIKFRVDDINGNSVFPGAVPMESLVISPIGGDYTIVELLYDGEKFVYNGTCPYSNPLILSGGEYDNIYADVLAMDRAQYELFLHSNIQNTITLGCVPDYSLDVNYRILYNPNNAYPPDSRLPEPEVKNFITKQVSYPLGMDGEAQTVNAIEVYDDFNYVGQAYDIPTT